MTRHPSGIDFEPDSDFEETDIEVDHDLASAAQHAAGRNIRHEAAPTRDPNAMRSRVSWNEMDAPRPNGAIGPAFALFLFLIVAAMVGAAWWWWTPSEQQRDLQEVIKSRKF